MSLPIAPAPTDGIVRAYQALRAVAVSFVVVAHFFPHLLPGGFIGVDVFFVISGFLITRHLMRELEDGSLDFLRFYARRARRLLPAALTVLVTTAVLSWFLLPPTRIAGAMTDIAAAALYGLNWRLAFNSVDYFADEIGASPVNHYWSLSVEEQFYLFWPALLFLWTIVLFRTSRRNPKNAAAFLLVLVIVSSFLWSVFQGSVSRSFNYFDTASRAWEFAVGGAVSLMVDRPVSRNRWVVGSIFPAWAGLFGSAIVLSPQSDVPGADAVLPVVCVALLLLIGDNHPFRSLARIIAVRPIQWLGDVSYSLYLWHWPPLVLAPFVLGHAELSLSAKLSLLGLSLMLAGATKVMIEDRFRGVSPRTRKATAGQILRYLGLSAASAAVFLGAAQVIRDRAVGAAVALYEASLAPPACFGALSRDGGAQCADSHRIADADYLLQNWDTQIINLPGGTACQNEPGDADLKPCHFGVSEDRKQLGVALLGDSHAGMWASALGVLAEKLNLSVDVYLASSCAATLDRAVFAVYLAPENREACRIWREAALHAIASDPAIDLVVVSGHTGQQKELLPTGEWADDSGQGFRLAWSALLDAGKRVLVLDDVPELPFKLPDCLAMPHDAEDPCTTARAALQRPSPLAKAAAGLARPGLAYLNFDDVFCDETICHSVIGGIPVYMDRDHISAPFARSMASRLEPYLRAAED